MSTWQARLDHRFVEHIPERLEPGELYISLTFATAAHLCACGCGKEVVTPLSPTDWRIAFDGASVSLDPSIGNWSFPCQSHYWVCNNQVRRSTRWSAEKIAAGRARDRAATERRLNLLVPAGTRGLLDDPAERADGIAARARRLARRLGTVLARRR